MQMKTYSSPHFDVLLRSMSQSSAPVEKQVNKEESKGWVLVFLMPFVFISSLYWGVSFASTLTVAYSIGVILYLSISKNGFSIDEDSDAPGSFVTSLVNKDLTGNFGSRL